MNEQKAREILGDEITKEGGLYDLGHYMCWHPTDTRITLDCAFEVEELEAIVWWMKNHGKAK
jgi:hypothetical protein